MEFFTYILCNNFDMFYYNNNKKEKNSLYLQ